MKTQVYFLLCKNDALYTGTVIDPLSRFKTHCAGRRARFTKMRKPVRLLGAFVYDSRDEALSNKYRSSASRPRKAPARDPGVR